MKITCPHCSHRGITPKQKFFASPNSPAKCNKCGELSAVEQGIKIKLVLFIAFLLMLLGYALPVFIYSIYSHALFMLTPLIIISCIPIAIYYIVPLAPISSKEIKHANTAFKTTVVLVIIYLLYEVSTIV